MMMTLLRGLIAGVVVIGVTQLAERWPRLGALLMTLPLVSIVAIVMTWQKSADLPTIARLSRETLVLVPLGLPFFVPLALAERLGFSFWPALAAGVGLACLTIGAWFWLGPPPR
ncbi:DUF3147 family protein [Botrimarina sp.]|uniref:DUF3147 family protein n=1 Tax=Botrimarina sp. TaxID=2795802 RepID=UPI0032EC9E22